MYHRHDIVNQFIQSAQMKFRIFSNLFDFQRVGTTSTCVEVLFCHGKSSSHIPTS